jgi:hypothetical protein
LKDIGGLAQAVSDSQDATAPPKPAIHPVVFTDHDEEVLWRAFDRDPKQALALAITGLRRLQEQALPVAVVAAPAHLDKETVLRLRKELPLSLEPWGETMGFAHAVQAEVNLVRQKALRSR